MKKSMIVVATLLAVILSVVCLTACISGDKGSFNGDKGSVNGDKGSVNGGKDLSDNEMIAGTWKFYSMSYEHTTFKVGDTFMEEDVLTEDFFVLEMSMNNTVIYKSAHNDDHIGYWTKDGNKFVVDFDDETVAATLELTLNGDTLTCKIVVDLNIAEDEDDYFIVTLKKAE